MTIADIIARIFLSFSHETMILPIIIIGYTFYDRRRWGTAIYIMLFTMIFAKFLKNIWQIPLPEHLGIKDYAFPSGHMQATVAFYGWVMLQCRNRAVTLICLGIMTGVAYGLLHFGYHGMRDIMGGLGFGVLSLGAYSYVLNKFFVNNPEKIGFLLALAGVVLIYFIPPITFLWLPIGALVGFAVGWTVAKSVPMPLGLWNKILALVTNLTGVGIIKLGAGLAETPSALVIFLTYALVGFWISVTPWLISLRKLSK